MAWPGGQREAPSVWEKHEKIKDLSGLAVNSSEEWSTARSCTHTHWDEIIPKNFPQGREKAEAGAGCPRDFWNFWPPKLPLPQAATPQAAPTPTQNLAGMSSFFDPLDQRDAVPTQREWEQVGLFVHTRRSSQGGQRSSLQLGCPRQGGWTLREGPHGI
jgi:hypothetical protein